MFSTSATSSSSFCINTFYNDEIIIKLQKLTRAGQRLLLFALSRLSNPGNNYLDRSVRISFSDYCSLIQQPYNNQITHGTIRNAFYDIKYNNEIIENASSVYSELTHDVIMVFKQEFMKTLSKSTRVALPVNLFISNKGDEAPSIPLALAIYSNSATKKPWAKRITISIREIIHLLGGKFSDYSNPPKNWKVVYVKRISSTLMKFKKTGLIKSYCFNLDGKIGFDPDNCNNEPHDGTDKTDSIIQNTSMVLNYESMTKYYRTYMDVNVVITV